MYPEVIEYFDTISKIEDANREWENEQARLRPRYDYSLSSNSDYHEKYNAWADAYSDESRKRTAKTNRTTREAMATLREKTSDPMVSWMMEHLATGYGGYVNSVLKILPATRDELETLANSEDWCDEFDNFMAQATEAGAIAPANPKYDAQKIVKWVADEFDVYGRRYRSEIQAMVNTIVEKALDQERARIMEGEQKLMQHVPLKQLA